MRSIRHFGVGVGVVVALTALFAGQASAASRVAYTLEIGGDNHYADWKIGTRTAYTRGSSADGQAVYNGGYLNYAVVLEASGIHSQPGHPSDGKEIFGAANIVFNVELLDAANNPVGDVIFKSTINDGNTPDPLAAAAFSLSYTTFGIGRLIDPSNLGGPRLEPIFTYPTAPVGAGKIIGMGAGFKEWVRTGAGITRPGVGMDTIPGPNPADPNTGRRPGLGIVPIAEGQIDISNLAPGTYVLKVTPGNGNNVLRGDFDMYSATNRPAFAVAANETVGDTITFTVTNQAPCTAGIVGRYVFYNNSAWDDPTKGGSDDLAIATDKQALLPGQTATLANYISYSKGLNGVMVDVCKIVGSPEWGTDVLVLMGNNSDPNSWPEAPQPTIVVRPGEGVDGSDRLVLTWPDNAIPNKNWIAVGLFNGGAFSMPSMDLFCFGLAIGEATGEGAVNASDEIAARNHQSGFTQVPVTNVWDFNRDKLVNATDQIVARNNKTGFTPLVLFTWQ